MSLMVTCCDTSPACQAVPLWLTASNLIKTMTHSKLESIHQHTFERPLDTCWCWCVSVWRVATCFRRHRWEMQDVPDGGSAVSSGALKLAAVENLKSRRPLRRKCLEKITRH